MSMDGGAPARGRASVDDNAPPMPMSPPPPPPEFMSEIPDDDEAELGEAEERQKEREQEEEEEASGLARRKTLAERMARLGGVRLGAPGVPPPPVGARRQGSVPPGVREAESGPGRRWSGG